MPNRQRGDLKGLTKHGHPKEATRRNTMHVRIEHTTQKRIIQILQSEQGLLLSLSLSLGMAGIGVS